MKAAREDGLERLRQEADRRVGQESKTLVEKLTEKAKTGDLGYIKLLVTLAERKKPRELPKKKARGINLAQRLDEQPEFQGEAKPEE